MLGWPNSSIFADTSGMHGRRRTSLVRGSVLSSPTTNIALHAHRSAAAIDHETGELSTIYRETPFFCQPFTNLRARIMVLRQSGPVHRVVADTRSQHPDAPETIDQLLGAIELAAPGWGHESAQRRSRAV